jgi:hypothetical protein
MNVSELAIEREGIKNIREDFYRRWKEEEEVGMQQLKNKFASIKNGYKITNQLQLQH